jgi:hypothetical protein
MENMNVARAFNLAASIGYSMFWSSRVRFDATSKTFSIIFLLFGRVVIGGILLYSVCDCMCMCGVCVMLVDVYVCRCVGLYNIYSIAA